MSLISTAGLQAAPPLIQFIRVSFITGDDNLRGDSGLDFKYWLDDSSAAPQVIHLFPYAPAPFGAPNWVRYNDHTVHEEAFAIPAVELSRIRNVGIGHVRDDSDDQWKMAGIVVVGITGTGLEYVIYANVDLNFYFRRVNLYSTVDRVTDWKSRPFHYVGLEPPTDEFDSLAVYIKTGTDDLRRGSRAYLRIHFKDSRILEVPLIDPDRPEHWDNRDGRNLFFHLRHRYRHSNIHQVRVRFEGEKDGGRGRDEWDIDAAWVDGYLATPPLARLEGMGHGDRRPIAAKPALRAPGAEYDAGHIRWDGHAMLRYDGPLPWASAPNSVDLDLSIDTGGDGRRADSEVFLQFHRPDGTFYERQVAGFYGEASGWESHSTETKTVNFARRHAGEFFTGFRVRFVGSEFGAGVGGQVDEWTFDGIEMALEDPATGAMRPLVSTRGENHHFRESDSHWIGDLGRRVDPLTEDEGLVLADTIWAEIPPIRDVRFVPYYNGSVPPVEMTFPEWYDAFLTGRRRFDQEKGPSQQESAERWGKGEEEDEKEATQDALFSRYAFALGNGGRVPLFLTFLPRDPETGQARLAVTYRRMLGATDVNYRLRHCDDLRKWSDLISEPGDVHVLPDHVNGVEWCEVIVRGARAKGASGFFSVYAQRR